MLRSRFVRSVLLVAGAAGVLYLLVSMFVPSPRKLIFGVDRHNGSVRLVRSSVAFLPPHQFYRLAFEKRDGYAQRDGILRITSREGVPVMMNYRLRFGITGRPIPDARRLVNDGWTAWMQARVGEAVSAVTQKVSIEDLLSPTSQFNAQRDPLRQTVARHLGESGLKVTAFEIARLDVDKDALLRAKRVELRRDSRSVPGRIAVFAIDGADWELLSELSDDGRIPNIKALVKGGTTASVQTIQPTVSSLLWTTVATGLPPERHGVIDFVDHANGDGPVDSYTRRTPALWDITQAFGRSTMVVNWWTAWPPSSSSSVVFDAPVETLQNAISPPSLAARVNAVAVPVDTVGFDQVRRFLNVTADEYQNAVTGADPLDPIVTFRNVLAKTWTDHRVAINLYHDMAQRNEAPLVLMMSYEGTDAVNHLFAAYHPPYREDVGEQSYRKYWPAVSNYYSEVDRLIGEWMGVLPPDTTVMLVSAHGYRWGKNRTRSLPGGGTSLPDHRNPGVFIGYGAHIAASRSSHTMSVFDLAPTMLALEGLPASTEMPGHVMSWAFKDVTPIQSVRVVSYAEFVNDRPAPSGVRLDAPKFQQNLRAIGHQNDPSRNLTPVLDDDQPSQAASPLSPEKWASYAYYNNLGVQLRGQGKLKDSVDAFQKAIDLNPARPVPYLNMAMALFDRQQYTAAEDVFVQAVAKGLPDSERYFIDFAALYRQKNMTSRAIAILYKGKAAFPQSYLIAANLASALAEVSRYSEALPEMERALGLQPSSTLVLNNLGNYYAKKEDYGRALDYWNRSLGIDAHQPQIRDIAVAARSRL